MTDPLAITDISTLLEAGRKALDSGDTFEARNCFRRVTELDEQNVGGWLGLGETTPKYREKADYYRRALTLDPGSLEAREGLAEAERQIAAGHILVPRQPESPGYREVPPVPQPELEPTSERCYVHPAREAYVRCMQCNRPICSACVNPSPVGQLCPECRKQRRAANYQVSTKDLLVGFAVAFAVTLVTGGLVAVFVRGFLLFFLIIIGPSIAELIVRAVERTTKMKRGREMQIAVSVAIVLGCIAAWMFVFPNLFALALYCFLAVSAANLRLR
jgi:hypothetical protein